MSSSDRRAFLSLLAALPLAACGFTPVYGPEGGGGALRGRIRAEDPNDRFGYAFVARIEDRLGRPEAPDWALGYRIETEEIATGISPENDTTRYNITGRLDWTLGRPGDETPLFSGRIDSFTAYSATGTTVATRAARRDAEERLMTILADRLVSELYARAGALGG